MDISADQSKLEAIISHTVPHNIKEAQRFFGLAGWYQCIPLCKIIFILFYFFKRNVPCEAAMANEKRNAINNKPVPDIRSDLLKVVGVV